MGGGLGTMGGLGVGKRWGLHPGVWVGEGGGAWSAPLEPLVGFHQPDWSQLGGIDGSLGGSGRAKIELDGYPFLKGGRLEASGPIWEPYLGSFGAQEVNGRRWSAPVGREWRGVASVHAWLLGQVGMAKDICVLFDRASTLQ